MTYLIIAVVCIIQSAIFTLNSRSRASGNAAKHFGTSMLSNGTYFLITFMLIFPEIFKSVAEGDLKQRFILLGIYTVCNAFGSYVMIKINLGHWKIKGLTEEGKSKVGSR